MCQIFFRIDDFLHGIICICIHMYVFVKYHNTLHNWILFMIFLIKCLLCIITFLLFKGLFLYAIFVWLSQYFWVWEVISLFQIWKIGWNNFKLFLEYMLFEWMSVNFLWSDIIYFINKALLYTLPTLFVMCSDLLNIVKLGAKTFNISSFIKIARSDWSQISWTW